MEEAKREKADREAENKALGKVCDIDFDLMIAKNRFRTPLQKEHVFASNV